MFNSEGYSRWIEEAGFWREIHSFAEDGIPIAEMALSSSDILRTLLVSSLRDAKNDKTIRSFPRLFAALDKEFQRDSTELAMNRLALFNTCQRFPGESIPAFWIRFQKVWSDAKTSGLDITDKMKPIRSFQPLGLSEVQRMTMLAAMSSAINPHFPILLNDLSVKLFSHPLRRDKHEEVSVQNASENGTMEDSEESYQTYLAQAKIPK